MPFDGTHFAAQNAHNTGLFPIWSRQGWHHWINVRFRHGDRVKHADVFLRGQSPSNREIALVRLLQDAKELIENPKNDATISGRRCAVGALRAAASRLDGPNLAWWAHDLLIRVARSRGFTSVEAMNDHSSHAAILAVFDEAIALARAEAIAFG
jgi:hypothetical protein